MRTTLTLDDDVAALVRREVTKRRVPLKVVVNEALRRGLEVMARPARRRAPYRVTPFDLGGSLVGSLDNIEEVLSRVEGEDHP
ncbi:MAG: DUF2191 domain-containing protein [Acidobacteriota bacterium]